MIFSQDIGIDLGTTNTAVCVKSKGIVLREPSVVAVDIKNTPPKVVAVGEEAKRMVGRTPGSITAIRPVKESIIADFNTTAAMLREFLRKAAGNGSFSRSRVLIGIPANITEVERKAVHDAAKAAGARYVSLIDASMAAAVGAGLRISEPAGSMIVDIGGGAAEVAVISLGDIVASRAIKTAGDAFDEAIVQYVRRTFNLLIGERTAEEIKLTIGSALPYEGEGAMRIRGRNLADGLPHEAEITSANVREALGEPLNRIIEMIRSTLEKTPPELSGDIIQRGITLTGGGAQLRGFDRLLAKSTGIPVRIAAKPMDCVATGIAICLQKNTLNLRG